MGKDCVPKVDGYWLLKQKTFDKCGIFGPAIDPSSIRADPCCVRKDCFVFCVEQCYRFVMFYYIPKSESDPYRNLQPLIGVFDKEYDECGNFRQFVLYLVSAETNTTFKMYPVGYKKKCVKCFKYIATRPTGNFNWFYPQREGTYDPFNPNGPTGVQKDCDKCDLEDVPLPQAVAHGSAKRIKQRKVCKALRDCECLDLTAFTRALEELPPCEYC